MQRTSALEQKPYLKDALRLMMLGEGWKVLFERIVARIASLDDNYIFRPGACDHEMLCRALGERDGLTRLVRDVYGLAQEPCPFDTQRLAFLSSLAVDVREPSSAAAPARVDEEVPAYRPRRHSGSIA